MRTLIVHAIEGYQRRLSPQKGFCCAYGAETGRWTCSSYGLKIARRRGVVAFARGMIRQFGRCRDAERRLLAGALTMAASQPPASDAAGVAPAEKKQEGWCSRSNAACCIDVVRWFS